MFTPLFLCFESYYFFQLKQNKTPANQCNADFFFFLQTSEIIQILMGKYKNSNILHNISKESTVF